MTNKLPVVGKRYRATDSNKFIHNKNFVLTCDEVSDYMIILNKKEDASYIGWPAKDFFDDYEELPEDKAETKLDAITAKHWEEAGRDYFSSAKYSKIKQIRSEEVNKAWYDGYRTALQAQTKPETQSHFVDINKMELSPEVKEAMEELRKECSKPIKEKSFEPCNFKPITMIEEYFTLLNKVKIFFNALDKQFKVNKTSESVDVKEEDKEESIWKPVNELPKEAETVIIKNDCDKNYFAEFRPSTRFGTDTFLTMDNEEFIPLDFVGKYCTLTDYINNIEQRLRKLEGK